MSEPYQMATRIRQRFGYVAPVENAFEWFRAFLHKGTWCMGGCTQEKEYFVPARLAGQGRCCFYCFQVRINDKRIAAFCWHHEEVVPIRCLMVVKNYMENYIYHQLVGHVVTPTWTPDDLEKFITYCRITHFFSETTTKLLLSEVAIPVLGSKWVRSDHFLLVIHQLVETVPVVNLYYEWIGKKKKMVARLGFIISGQPQESKIHLHSTEKGFGVEQH